MQQQAQSNGVMTGKVAWFSSAKGFGFLNRSDKQPDVFVHYSQIIGEGYKTLGQGDEVQFAVEIGPKGRPQAARVTVVRRAS